MIERERKFLVDVYKLLATVNLSCCRAFKIKQAYLSTEDNEIRIRKVEYPDRYECFLTVKSKGTIARMEVENKISYDMYSSLIVSDLYKGNVIEKLRYQIPLENKLIAELDIYDKELYGLITVEVEFKEIEDANNFIIPEWFGKEVTEDKKYKNRNLALDGNPIR